MKKVLSLVMTLMMVVGAIVPAMAQTGTNTVTLHKLLMDQERLAAWDTNGPAGYDGSQDLQGLNALESMAGNSVSEISGVFFYWINADDEYINANGQVVASIDEALSGTTRANGFSFDTSNLPAGDYKIHEDKTRSTHVRQNSEVLTGQKAVPVEITLPLANESGVVADAHVYPKNSEEAPDTTKDFADQFNGTEHTRDEATNPMNAPENRLI